MSASTSPSTTSTSALARFEGAELGGPAHDHGAGLRGTGEGLERAETDRVDEERRPQPIRRAALDARPFDLQGRHHRHVAPQQQLKGLVRRLPYGGQALAVIVIV